MLSLIEIARAHPALLHRGSDVRTSERNVAPSLTPMCYDFETVEEARIAIFDWINWYNKERIHSSIRYLSPVKFEELLLKEVA